MMAGMVKKRLNHSSDKVTLELTRHELHLANALIQEVRISHVCDSSGGQALENGIRTVVIMSEEAAKSDYKCGDTH